MFTGIVEEMGRVTGREERGGLIVMTVEAPTISSGLGIGASIALSGVCLTVTHLDGKCFRMDVSNETARRTNLGRVEVGGRVNLELPLRVNDQLGGHIVQGHVDEVGTILSSEQQGGDRIMRIGYPRGSDPYVVEKGSIAVDGVSLTIAACDRGWFEVMLIPHTLAVTTLGEKGSGDEVNLEYDILAKHLVRLAEVYWDKDKQRGV
jgi:riboflavin synthase